MYKDSSCRSSPQPTPPKLTPTTTAITATAEAASDNNTVDVQASSKESIAITTTTKSTTATTKTLTAESTASDRDNKTGQAAANKCDDSTPSAAKTYTEPESPTGEFTVSASAVAATRIIETSPAPATSAPHLSNSTSTGTGTGNTPITLSLAAEHLEAAEYYQLSCASDCSVSSSTSLSSAANTSCGSSASDDSDENSEVYTFRARPAFPAHVLQSAPKRRAHWRREHAHAELSVDVDSRRGSAVSGWSGVTGVSGGGGSSSGQRRRHHAQHASVSADVRALRKIGYIASRVRFLAKIYGDFKLVNPYSPAKQRKQLQDILLRHSIPETDRKGAAAASGYRKKRETTAQTATGTPPISQRSLTPDSSLASSSCKAEVGVTRITRAPRAEEEPTLSSFEDDDEAVVENIAEDVEDAEEEEEETSATFTAGTVRRKSSVLATSATAYDATRARSLAVLEELLVQFYEQRQHRITVIRRRHLSRRGSSTRGNGKIAGSNSATAQQPQHLIIMSGGSAVSTDSNASQHLMHTNAPNEVEQQTNLRNANNIYNNSDATAELAQQGSGSGTPSVASNISSQTKQKSTQPPPPPQQHQHQQQRSYSNAFLQPPFSGIGGGCMDRRRRASDCSAHPSSQQLLQQQLLSNQLQVTLKNNNFTVGGGKFPYHRGSCGGAGEHLLAANTIANRSTIILSKSCSNVEGVPTTAAVAATAAALYGDSTRKFSLGGHVDAPSNGNLVSSPALTPSPTAKQPYTTSSQSQQQQQQQQQPTAGGPGSNGNNEYNIVQLNNTIIQCHFNDEDFRALVKDLKRKVEYTERMNWLCLSKRPMGPPHRKSSLPKHQEVKKRFLEICDTNFSEEVKAALRLPAFDSYEWSDADVIHLMQTMFLELGFIDKFNIPIETLREWLYEVYKHYNEVPFHNFRHCFCVAQMMYAMTKHANLLQRLGDLECLILLVSCICHDLDHPGYNNIYQINARTELALRYNDISPLENHHCSIAFRLLEHPECNIFKNFSGDTFKEIREGIIRCILATDMARHNEILTQFKEITPVFDYSNRAHINLLCMVLIKVADISNEARPMDVAEPWLDRLLQEFFAQSAAEKSEGLPVTPFMDPDKVSKPGSQVRFIGLVLLPLFEALGELVPEVIELIIIPVRIALDYYRRLNDAQAKSRKSVADTASMAASDNISAASDGGTSTTAGCPSGAVTGGGGGGGSGGAHVHSPAAGTNGQITSTSTGTATTTAGSSAGGGSGSGGTNSGGSISPQMPRSQSGISVKSRRSIPSQKSASRTSVDEPQCLAAELHDLPEGSESGDSETATEVDDCGHHVKWESELNFIHLRP